ncbi:hypothetical protein WMY93_027042 [Mugilogobius chulae]|uniref:Reverse transcriptase domain-containing protein n=1 Tax=Mugilogobius chulae TaxID=88201 RepID=A0AAW0MYL2_9GOBI
MAQTPLTGTQHHWIVDFLSNRPQSVRVGKNISSTLVVNTRVPQGCVLSPLLYTLYTHDGLASSASNLIIKFADDTTTCSKADQQGLQRVIKAARRIIGTTLPSSPHAVLEQCTTFCMTNITLLTTCSTCCPQREEVASDVVTCVSYRMFRGVANLTDLSNWPRLPRLVVSGEVYFSNPIKILLITFKALHNLAPPYLTDLLHRYTPARSLRSSDSNRLLLPAGPNSEPGATEPSPSLPHPMEHATSTTQRLQEKSEDPSVQICF